jgi:hypothetical protein
LRNQQTFSAAAADDDGDDEREQNVWYPFVQFLVGRSANV